MYIDYGMSEAGGISRHDLGSIPNASVGKLSDGVQIKITNKQNQCGRNEIGEIYVKQPHLFMGYYNKGELSVFNDRGWFGTGDIGYFDENDFLYITDRDKDILDYCDVAILPSEIENVIMKHPGIRYACVVGVPDVDCCQLPAAFIIKNGIVEVNPDDIHELVNGMQKLVGITK